jgi:serine protease inhibitor
MMCGASEPEELPVVEMNLNRPFIYLITANDGSTLFIGVVRNPNG